VRVGLDAGMLAEEVVLVGSGKRGVRVGRSDDAVFVRIDPGALLDRQPALQRLAHIAAGVVARLGWLVVEQVVLVPAQRAVACEFIVGRQERVRLAVALDLGDLDDRFVAGAAPRVARAHRTAAGFHQLPHQPVRQVAVVRDRQNVPAGGFFIALHIVPQRFGRGVAAIVERQHGLDLVDRVAENHVAVQVVAALHQRVFKAVECSELARFVIALDHVGAGFPDRAGPLFRGLGIVHRPERFAATLRRQDLGGGLQRILRRSVEQVMPAQQPGIADQQSRRIVKRLGRTEPGRVIRDDQEIERPIELRLEPGGRGHFITARKAQRGFGRKPVAEAEGVDRIRGVEVRISPEHAFGHVGQRHLAVVLGGHATAWQQVASGQRQRNRAQRDASDQDPCLFHCPCTPPGVVIGNMLHAVCRNYQPLKSYNSSSFIAKIGRCGSCAAIRVSSMSRSCSAIMMPACAARIKPVRIIVRLNSSNPS
jgi:hypothetical protein